MENSKKVKILLMMLLLTSCVAAFCLGTLTYTFATGEMPFELKALEQFRPDIPEEQPKHKAAIIPYQVRTPDELTLRELADDFTDRINSLNDREKQIEESKVTMEALIKNAETIRTETVAKLEEIKKEKESKLSEIAAAKKALDDAQKAFDDSQVNLEEKIIKKIAGTLSLMQPTASMVIISDLDVLESARFLNEMDARKRSEILSQMVTVTKLNDKELSNTDQLSFRLKANEIIKELRKLKENPEGGQTP